MTEYNRVLSKLGDKIINRGFLFSLIDFIQGTSTINSIDALRIMEYDREKIRSIQKGKLRALLRWSYDTVPFYRRTMSQLSLNPHCDEPFYVLSKMPVLKKDTIRKYFSELNTCRFRRKIAGQTSGSTGMPLTFLHDFNTISVGSACFYYGLSWYGYKLGDKLVRLWGRRPVMSRKSRMISMIMDPLRNFHDLNAHFMSEEHMLNYYLFLRRKKPKVLYGYVSSLCLLSSFLEKQRLEPPKIGFLVTTAEMLNRYQREHLASAFDSEVYDQYGSVEVASIAFECPFHQGLHVMQGHVIVELIKDGCEVSEGEVGNVIVTDLDNFQMPLIRYSIEDLAKKGSSTCSCGRKLQKLKSIEGRTSDIIVGLNGNRVHGEFFTHLIESTGIAQRNLVEKFQVIQKSRSTIIFKIKSEIKLSKQQFDLLTRLVQSYLGDVEIVYEQTDDIEPHPSGKHRFTVSELA